MLDDRQQLSEVIADPFDELIKLCWHPKLITDHLRLLTLQNIFIKRSIQYVLFSFSKQFHWHISWCICKSSFNICQQIVVVIQKQCETFNSTENMNMQILHCGIKLRCWRWAINFALLAPISNRSVSINHASPICDPRPPNWAAEYQIKGACSQMALCKYYSKGSTTLTHFTLDGTNLKSFLKIWRNSYKTNQKVVFTAIPLLRSPFRFEGRLNLIYLTAYLKHKQLNADRDTCIMLSCIRTIWGEYHS